MAATAPAASPAGAVGVFPLADSLGVVHGRARRLGVRASSAPGHPIRARDCGEPAGTVRFEAKGKEMRLRETVWLTCGPYPSARERKREGRWLGGLRLRCGLGRLVRGLGRFWPKSVVNLLEQVLNLDIK
jgi:hypothetical protein